MSCKAMGMGGGLVIAGITLAAGVYGCGPNIIVGVFGASISGVLAIKDNVQKAFLETEFTSTTDEVMKMDLAQRIRELNENEKLNLDLCSRFAWSMIPVAGPFIAMSKSV